MIHEGNYMERREKRLSYLVMSAIERIATGVIDVYAGLVIDGLERRGIRIGFTDGEFQITPYYQNRSKTG